MSLMAATYSLRPALHLLSACVRDVRVPCCKPPLGTGGPWADSDSGFAGWLGPCRARTALCDTPRSSATRQTLSISFRFNTSQHPAGLGRADLEANDYLHSTVHSLPKTNLDLDYVIHHGPAAKAIVDCAANLGLQQTVMATRGESGLSRSTNGSAAERVVQAATASLPLVRGRGRVIRSAQEPISFRLVPLPEWPGPICNSFLTMPVISNQYAVDRSRLPEEVMLILNAYRRR
jgi:nucleotide-binding universal stress UspA family protein